MRMAASDETTTIRAARACTTQIEAATARAGEGSRSFVLDPVAARVAGAAAMAGVRGSDLAFGDPAFVADVTRRFPNASYVSSAAHAYDAVEALLEAYKRAPEPKAGPALRAALAGVKIAKGKAGVPVVFDEYGDAPYDPERSYSVAEFDDKGQIRPLGPTASARRRRLRLRLRRQRRLV